MRDEALSDRHLFLPKGAEVAQAVRAIVRTRIDPTKISSQCDRIVHLAASVHSGQASAVEALGLLANLVMAWNTAQMQAAYDRLNARKSTAIAPELIGRIAPTRTEGINLRGVFRFPLETYAERLLPSAPQKAIAAEA